MALEQKAAAPRAAAHGESMCRWMSLLSIWHTGSICQEGWQLWQRTSAGCTRGLSRDRRAQSTRWLLLLSSWHTGSICQERWQLWQQANRAAHVTVFFCSSLTEQRSLAWCKLASGQLAPVSCCPALAIALCFKAVGSWLLAPNPTSEPETSSGLQVTTLLSQAAGSSS